MYKKDIYTVISNTPLTKDVYRMVLEGDTEWITRPGQFVNIELEGLYLRRPISISDWDERTITIIYKVVGRGTEQMSKMAQGVKLDLLTGLGNGFDTSIESERPLLVGGGVGVPPLYRLAKDLLAQGKQVSVVLGFNTSSEIFYADEFKALGVDLYISTADGSMGVKGFVTDAIREAEIKFDYFYSCGPLPMLKALCDCCEVSGELSFEERMGCGFGACMGCSCKTLAGNKRICKDGPVMKREEIIW
ncbi:MAG: dihydroorotate dehydrogenase electron transfer subunit [Alistipes sp.]|jgi:dihydroorotate dehydrogenase electron transfer subunit|nr:dihydroorotate dehydrogenase electron transfer subunit [Alistipes sp.]MBQ5624113.1 dihydroorotate dehydrogenase electron transfer subunit [Alistipes sp.]MBQ5785821.1 dihydroorotate dehydrogenase electron transfer subunit [Alistipes sp.]